MTCSDLKPKPAEVLRRGGIFQPGRLLKLIGDAITFLELDLSGLVILTEAASGPYVVTPIIASMAKAERVMAITYDSCYATAEAVRSQTRALETMCGIERRVEIYEQRSPDLFAKADIVTNLGLVRPIDAEAVAVMKATAVIPLMYEAWEFRPDDVDLKTCRRKGILVLGTNESYPGLEVFTYCGHLCLKMLFDAQIEVYNSTIAVVSQDRFGHTIQQTLKMAGASVRLIDDLYTIENRSAVQGAEALVVADYSRSDSIIGNGADISPVELSALASDLTVLQIAGVIDVSGLEQLGIVCYPGQLLGPHRMARTLSELGPKPVINLHAAGLKVGEMAAYARKKGLGPSEAEAAILRNSTLAQSLIRHMS